MSGRPAGQRAQAPAAGGPAVPRFGYALLLERLRAYQAQAAAQQPAAAGAMDRRRVLARLAAELQAPPEVLLRRGFDRAYRLVVEGL